MPVCVALALTIFARRMAARKVLVKNLSIIETVGAMTVLCSDKTGTLTQGNMHVEKMAILDAEYDEMSEISTDAEMLAMRVCYLCNDATMDASGAVVGNSTDVAVFKFVKNHSTFDSYSRMYAIAFHSKTKYMLIIVKGLDRLELYVKGAPDVLLPAW